MKIVFSFIALIVTINVFANNGKLPGITFKVATNNPIELVQLTKTTIQVKATLSTESTEYYELQRSYNNKDFNTVSLLMPFTEMDGAKPILLKDKITSDTKVVYYRIVKIKDEKISYTAQSNITIN